MKTEYVYDCKCGNEVRTDDPEAVDWRHLTQPARHICPNCLYDEDYFLRGRQSGKSLYEDYRWLPDLTIPMVCSIISHLKIRVDDTILDFGCARGYTVRAFREMGYAAYGFDTSNWAVANCDPSVRQFVSNDWVYCPPEPPLLPLEFDWVIAKDVLEHVSEVAGTIDSLIRAAKVGLFAVVPLSAIDGERYVVGCYEEDITHAHRLTLATWARLFMRPGWSVEARYRVNGVKDNYARYKTGNGFIVARRVKE